MQIGKPLLALGTALVLAGVGCAGKQPAKPVVSAPARNTTVAAPAPAPSQPSTDEQLPADNPTNTSASTPSPAEPPPADDLGTEPLETTVALDETWQTYANASLGFSFRWPSKGRYAPEWEVRFVPESDARIDALCFREGANERRAAGRVSVGDVQFCHTAFDEGAAGSRYLTDHYATIKGKTIIVITFTKKTTSAAALGCTGFELSASPTACVEFDEQAYLDLLDQSVSTFRYQ